MTLEFHKGVNILVGENNSGKTAIIDALRLCFGYGNQNRDIFVSTKDFYVDKNEPSHEIKDVEFDLMFEILNDHKAGIFYELLSVKGGGSKELQLHFRYYIIEKKGIKKVRYKIWGGDNEGQVVPTEALELIYFVYLSALRDAVQSLRPVRGNILGDLYSNIEQTPEKQKELAGKVENMLQTDAEWNDLIKSGKEVVNEHLEKTTITDKLEAVEIDFLPFEFRRILDSLRVQIPIYKELPEDESIERKFFDLFENGLGYNNLIYMAVVLGDLAKYKEIEEDSYVALLIEEPEAHLHPQLQNTFFSYLNEINNKGIQVFITSHSPTISAKASLDSIIVLEKQLNVSALPLISSNLDDNNRKYLHKFLDITKAQLFFSNGVILVEGISEVLLLPIFSQIMGDEFDLEKHGIEVVNINGVAFEHFGKIFNAEDQEKRLHCRCSILTDNDRDEESEEVSSRAIKAKDLEGKNLRVELAEETFEYELFNTGSNKDILLSIFNDMHPTASQNIEEGGSTKEHAKNFLKKVVSNKAKSELAHRLSVLLSEDIEKQNIFQVPDYIQKAIRWVVKGE